MVEGLRGFVYVEKMLSLHRASTTQERPNICKEAYSDVGESQHQECWVDLKS